MNFKNMRKLIFILTLLIPNFIYAQNSEDEEVKFGVFQMPHLYIDRVLEANENIVDNIPTKWILVNKDGLFHKPNKPELSSEKTKLSAWDSLFYANRGYLTFKLCENVYKKADTIRITDAIDEGDNGYEDPAGTIIGTFINGIKDGLWEKQARNAGVGGVYEIYKNGLLHGMRVVRDINGKSIDSTIFVEGTGNYYDYYYDTGRWAVSGFMVYGKRHGCWTYYNKERRVIREEYYKHGLLHGPFTIYDHAGNILYETHFKNGTGKYRRYKNDILMESGGMVDGCRIGKWEELRVIRNSSSPHYEPGINIRKSSSTYTTKSPINDPENIVDVMFYEGDYIYIRAMRAN